MNNVLDERLTYINLIYFYYFYFIFFFSLYQYFRRPDFFEGLKNVSFKGQTTVPHYLEMMGYHKNGFETILGEMEGTLVKVTHRMHLPASEYGDRPMYMQELNPEDKRLFNDTTWYHVNQDITNTARNASPKEE